MTILRRTWRPPIVVAIVGIASLALGVNVGLAASARAGASSAQTRGSETRDAGCMRMMGGPAVAEAMRALHSGHVADMRAWRSKYGSDPSTTAARAALRHLQREHREEMRAALRKAGAGGASAACAVTMMGTDMSAMMDKDMTAMMGTDMSAMMGKDMTAMMGTDMSAMMGKDTADMMGGMMGSSGAAGAGKDPGDGTDIHEQHHGGSSAGTGAGMMGGAGL